jgi:DDE superfamily endonuclease
MRSYAFILKSSICPFRWINGLYEWAKRQLTWDDNNKQDTPSFSKFTDKYGDKVVSILNVFEVLIPKPMNNEACMLTWSPLRDCYVIKYLLSVTPRGKVNFLSDGWGGVVTDKQITEECGFLDYIAEGEKVLTDEGFVPQLDKVLEEMECGLIECDKSNKDSLFYVIDVEKRVKELFPILDNVIPMYLLTEKSEDGMPLIDKIANIGCAIFNLIVADEQLAEVQTKAAGS